MKDYVALQSAKVVRAIHNGTNIQLLCSDERGLLSVYFEPAPFTSFYKLLRRSHLKLADLPVEFNREIIRVPSIDKTCHVYVTQSKNIKQGFSILSGLLKNILK